MPMRKNTEQYMNIELQNWRKQSKNWITSDNIHNIFPKSRHKKSMSGGFFNGTESSTKQYSLFS